MSLKKYKSKDKQLLNHLDYIGYSVRHDPQNRWLYIEPLYQDYELQFDFEINDQYNDCEDHRYE